MESIPIYLSNAKSILVMKMREIFIGGKFYAEIRELRFLKPYRVENRKN